MMTPHIIRITCAGAKSNQVRANGWANSRDNVQPAKAIRALLRVGMNHVESSRNGGHANVPFTCRSANSFCKHRIDLFRKALQPGTGKVELNAIEFVR